MDGDVEWRTPRMLARERLDGQCSVLQTEA